MAGSSLNVPLHLPMLRIAAGRQPERAKNRYQQDATSVVRHPDNVSAWVAGAPAAADATRRANLAPENKSLELKAIQIQHTVAGVLGPSLLSLAFCTTRETSPSWERDRGKNNNRNLFGLTTS